MNWWLWNDAQSWKQHRRGALLFFRVIRQISRSHGTKNCQFWPKLTVSGLQLQLEFTAGFEMMHKAWCGIEEVPYCFPRSSIKFHGHKGQQGKSEGFDSCDRPSNPSQIGFESSIFHPVWPWNLTDDPKNNGAPLLCYFKLFASFHSHWWIQTGVTVRKRLIWVNINAFF